MDAMGGMLTPHLPSSSSGGGAHMRPYHACRLPQPATRHPLPSMHACHCVPMLAPPATPPGLWHTCMRVTAPVTRLFLDLLHLARPPHLQLHEPLLALQLHVPLLKLLLLPHLLLQDEL